MKTGMKKFTSFKWRAVLLILTLAGACLQAGAQALTRRDADEIRVLAREKVKGLNDLLNAVAN